MKDFCTNIYPTRPSFFVVQLAGMVLPYGISGPLVAFVTSMILFIGVSLLTKKTELAPDIEKVLRI